MFENDIYFGQTRLRKNYSLYLVRLTNSSSSRPIFLNDNLLRHRWFDSDYFRILFLILIYNWGSFSRNNTSHEEISHRIFLLYHTRYGQVLSSCMKKVLFFLKYLKNGWNYFDLKNWAKPWHFGLQKSINEWTLKKLYFSR